MQIKKKEIYTFTETIERDYNNNNDDYLFNQGRAEIKETEELNSFIERSKTNLLSLFKEKGNEIWSLSKKEMVVEENPPICLPTETRRSISITVFYTGRTDDELN